MSADVDIWFRSTESLDEAAIAHAASVLSPDELARHRRFHFARDARDYVAAHALLRTTLSRGAARAPRDWRFERTPAGKPFLPADDGLPASFSLSHTHGMVACAVAKGADLGVDVECVDRHVDAARIAARFYAPAETAQLARMDEAARRDRFFDLWTLKEALVKALGVGMAVSLNRFAFTVQPLGAIGLDAPPDVDAGAWHFGLFAPSPRHRLAVACRVPRPGSPRFIMRSAAEADH